MSHVDFDKLLWERLRLLAVGTEFSTNGLHDLKDTLLQWNELDPERILRVIVALSYRLSEDLLICSLMHDYYAIANFRPELKVQKELVATPVTRHLRFTLIQLSEAYQLECFLVYV